LPRTPAFRHKSEKIFQYRGLGSIGVKEGHDLNWPANVNASSMVDGDENIRGCVTIRRNPLNTVSGAANAKLPFTNSPSHGACCANCGKSLRKA